MIKTGTEYLRDELSLWFKTLDFCRNEIPPFELRLVELIQRNAGPELASQSETFLNQFAELHNKINLLQMEINRLKGELNGHGRTNGKTNPQPLSPQNTLRENMQAIEKDFVETKYLCHQFLANVYTS